MLTTCDGEVLVDMGHLCMDLQCDKPMLDHMLIHFSSLPPAERPRNIQGLLAAVSSSVVNVYAQSTENHATGTIPFTAVQVIFLPLNYILVALWFSCGTLDVLCL